MIYQLFLFKVADIWKAGFVYIKVEHQSIIN